MSGSGPTVFGIFDAEDGCREAAKKLEKKGWRLYPAETLAGRFMGNIRHQPPDERTGDTTEHH